VTATLVIAGLVAPDELGVEQVERGALVVQRHMPIAESSSRWPPRHLGGTVDDRLELGVDLLAVHQRAARPRPDEPSGRVR
jgi:hypothetical protein